MNPRLSKKIMRPDFQGEFTASILAAAASPDLISFAGGLPNPVSFPVEAMDKATHKVLEKNGVMALQYSGTQGYLPLREWVAKRYETMGVYGVTADDIIITNVLFEFVQRFSHRIIQRGATVRHIVGPLDILVGAYRLAIKDSSDLCAVESHERDKMLLSRMFFLSLSDGLEDFVESAYRLSCNT